MSIRFDDLAAIRAGKRLPIDRLQPDDHVHGRLSIEVQRRVLPGLGYWGPNDVCLAQWLKELAAARTAFVSGPSACHTFDEGEQRQPAFVFEREDDRAFLTIADSKISDGVANPDWQRVEFLADDLVKEHDRFRWDFVRHLRAVSREADSWLARWHLVAR